jgi:hypothetical protein
MSCNADSAFNGNTQMGIVLIASYELRHKIQSRPRQNQHQVSHTISIVPQSSLVIRCKSRPPSRMMPQQLINLNAQGPRINIRIRQALGFHQRNTLHDAPVAISPPEIFDILLETSPWVTLLRFGPHRVLRAKVSPLAIFDAGNRTGGST